MRTKLNEKVANGQLLQWTPVLPGESCERTLFISKEINEEFDEDTWTDHAIALRYAALSADFDRFATGEAIPVGMEPYDKGDNAFMARIHPPEYGVWAIRSLAPKPAIRVFGAFCEKDVFVALLSYRRQDLGGRESRSWAQARENAIAKWDNLFPGESRVLGDKIEDFFSEKAIIV